MTPNTLVTKKFPHKLQRLTGAVLLMPALAFMVACQGFSSSGGSSQQMGNLALGTAVSFGNVAPGSSKTLTVTATNSGTEAINISSVAFSSKYFTLTAPTLPVSVAGGQSAALSLKFSPNATGQFNATLSIGSNALDAQTSVALSGTGSTAPSGALAISPSTEAFGSVADGTTQSQTVTLSNTSSTAVDISQVSVSGTGFQISGISAPLTLNASQSTTFTVSFSPQSAGSASGTVTITSDASDSTLGMTLSGTGVTPGALGSSLSSISFGSVQLNSKQTTSETLTNTGSASVTISAISASGTGFSVSGATTPVTLAAGQGTTFSVSFDPASAASDSGSVTVTSNASNPSMTIPLSGIGVAAGAVTSSPASISFGSVTVNTTQTTTATLINTGGSSVTISAILASGTGFSVSGATTPVTLAAGQGTTFSVSFDPTSAASDSGSVTVTSNASNPTMTIPLAGTGTAAPVGVLGSSPTSISFGSVTVNTKQTTSETVTNTGNASVTISQISASGTGFSVSGVTPPVTLAAGQGTTFSVSFDPASAASDSGSVTVTSNASNPTMTIPLAGTGAAAPVGVLGSSPTSISFGSVQVNTTQTTSETVTNTGNASVTISQISAGGTGFSVSGITPPVTLAAGQGATFSVSFDPTSAASDSGSVTVTSNASNPSMTIPLSGTGAAATGQLSASPATIAVGSVVDGTTGTGTGSLTASGASVTVTGASSSNSAFTITGLSLPVTIGAGQSLGFTVTFSPQTTGSASATLTFSSNASPATTQESATGTGTAAPSHTVSLSWTASSSSDISGYNVYRAVYSGSACGTFSKINPALTASTVYSDSSVTDGTAYCYAATTVNTSSQESGYSNIVTNVQIPAP